MSNKHCITLKCVDDIIGGRIICMENAVKTPGRQLIARADDQVILYIISENGWKLEDARVMKMDQSNGIVTYTSILYNEEGSVGIVNRAMYDHKLIFDMPDTEVLIRLKYCATKRQSG